MKDEKAAVARPETSTGVVPVVQLIWADTRPLPAQSTDVPYITNEVCLLFLRVELCHPVWERLIYSLKIPNSVSAMLMVTIGYCFRVFCALLENVEFELRISPHVGFFP